MSVGGVISTSKLGVTTLCVYVFRDRGSDGFLDEARASNCTPEGPICRCNFKHVLVHAFYKFPQTPFAQSTEEDSTQIVYKKASLSTSVVGCASLLSPFGLLLPPKTFAFTSLDVE